MTSPSGDPTDKPLAAVEASSGPVDEEGLFEPDLALRNARAHLAGLLGDAYEDEDFEDLPTPEPIEAAQDTIRPAPIEDEDEEEEDSDRYSLSSDTELPEANPTHFDGLDLDPRDPRFETGDDPRIPGDKGFFKIGEVAKLTGVKPYVLRYWETEFPWIRPTKTSSRQRLYRRQDIGLIFRIKRLRYDEELTIATARQRIKDLRGERAGKKKRKSGASVPAPAPALAPARAVMASSIELTAALAQMRRSVLDILAIVED